MILKTYCIMKKFQTKSVGIHNLEGGIPLILVAVLMCKMISIDTFLCRLRTSM